MRQTSESVTQTEIEVHSVDHDLSINGIVEFLGPVQNKGIRLWLESGQLHYRATKGALTPEEIERLRASRAQIVAFLEARVSGAEIAGPRPQSCPWVDLAPLAFSQQAHWQLNRLSERPGERQIASVTRLTGKLDIAALERGLREVIRRHDTLRTRIVVLDSTPMQEICGSSNCELTVEDLTDLSEGPRDIEVRRRIVQLIVDPVDVAIPPLFVVRLLRIRDEEHVLIVAMNHMISDMFSISLLLRDLFTAYTQTVNGRAFSLPAIPVQFADYAVWQRTRPWIEKHGTYWKDTLGDCGRLRFPEDHNLGPTARTGWSTVPLNIGRDIKNELREWCRLTGTTLVMSVFTAYVGLVLRWCNTPESVIRYQSDGRVSPDLENTIGFFASALYLRIALGDDDTFLDVMNRVVKEYCSAYEHADCCYMAAMVPRPEFTRNTVFNWIPQGSKLEPLELDATEGSIKWSPVRFSNPMLERFELDHEPGIILFDFDDEVDGHVHFPLNRFSHNTMERFGRNFLMLLTAMVRNPEVHVKDVSLV